MNRKSYRGIAGIRRGVAMLVIVGLFLSAALLSACATETITQAAGDQDLLLGHVSITVAGQLADWQGVGNKVWVFVITTSDCKQSPSSLYINVPADGKLTPFAFKETCNGVPWTITGAVDNQGDIASAQAS